MSKKVGNPGKKTPERLEAILKLTKEGKTEQQVADLVGISLTSLRFWLKNDLEFMIAMRQNKQECDELVEASVFKRAIGMNYFEEALGKDGPISVQKYAVPDVRAAQYWLNNRQPKKWRDRVEMVHEAGASLLLNLGNKKKEFPV